MMLEVRREFTFGHGECGGRVLGATCWLHVCTFSKMCQTICLLCLLFCMHIIFQYNHAHVYTHKKTKYVKNQLYTFKIIMEPESRMNQPWGVLNHEMPISTVPGI